MNRSSVDEGLAKTVKSYKKFEKGMWRLRSFPLVSVVVTTKNEESNIADCLQSIRNQIYPDEKLEIIVVDNYSSDKTAEIAKKFTSRVYTKGPQRSAQLNFGVQKATGKYVLYPDADMILSEKVVMECLDKSENEDYVALYIPERIIGKGFLMGVRDFERSFYNATCIDSVRFVRREVFLEIGSFDENLDFGPDDWDFDRRVRKAGNVGIIAAPLYHNEGRLNLKGYLEKKGRYSKSFEKYVQKWGEDDLEIKKQLGIWYRLFGVFIEDGKWKKLLRHPIKTSGMYFLRFMVGITYLRSRA
jgi:glycosyltransferase involved in cell wall biosynthesis